MIVTAIVDPTALDRKYWKNDKLYRHQIELFLKDILINGLLISDQNGKLLRELAEKIEPIQGAKTLFEEIKKNKRVVKYNYPTQHQETWKICYELERYQPPDVIITGEDYRRDINDNTYYSQAITFGNYLKSPFKEKRDSYLVVKPLHELEFSECKDLFTRVIQFASSIRIYDKQIGKGKNLPGFRRGISFILDLWKKSDSYCNRKVEVEIYTFQSDHGHTAGALDQETAATRISQDLVAQLRTDFRLPLELFIKCDCNGHHHARYLQTESAILLLERGFDFIDNENDGMVKPTEISLKPKSRDHLRKIRNLPFI